MCLYVESPKQFYSPDVVVRKCYKSIYGRRTGMLCHRISDTGWILAAIPPKIGEWNPADSVITDKVELHNCIGDRWRVNKIMGEGVHYYLHDTYEQKSRAYAVFPIAKDAIRMGGVGASLALFIPSMCNSSPRRARTLKILESLDGKRVGKKQRAVLRGLHRNLDTYLNMLQIPRS